MILVLAGAPAALGLVTAPWATHSEVVELADGAVRGRFEHVAGAAVRGAMMPGVGVVAVADTASRKDVSFAASLFVLEEGRAARRLCDEVVHASRPIVSADGRVFVVRGAAGPESEGPQLRADFLRIDEVDRETGVARTIHRFTGQLLHFAGWYEGALLVYRIDGDLADIVALGVDGDAGAVRTVLADLPPYARDFSVDAGGLVFLDRDEVDTRRWQVLRVDLRGGGLSSLAVSDTARVGPLASAGAVYVASAGGPLRRVGGAGPAPRSPCAEVAAPGDRPAACADVLRVGSADGRWGVGLHHRPGALPRPFMLETASGASTLLPAMNAWVEPLGFAAEVQP